MPFPREYTRRRRQIMTAVMWLVLGGAVGLAALVSHRSADPVKLSEPVRVGEIRIALPEGWEVKSNGGFFDALLGTAELTGKAPDGSRVVSIAVTDGSDTNIESQLFFSLASNDVVEPSSRGVVDFGTLSGQWMAGDCPRELHRTRQHTGVIAAAARLRSGNILRLELKARHRAAADIQLVKRIAATVEPAPALPASRPSSNKEP